MNDVKLLRVTTAVEWLVWVVNYSTRLSLRQVAHESMDVILEHTIVHPNSPFQTLVVSCAHPATSVYMPSERL